MILSGADNRPPMLDKDLYDSLKSRMEIYMQNTEHGRMLFESVEHGPLIWPTIKENRVTRTNKYVELVAKDLWERIQVLMQEQFQVNTKFLNSLPFEWRKFVTDVKHVKDLHTNNFDQIHAYFQQHDLHTNEVRIMCERNHDPLALVANPGITEDPVTYTVITHNVTYQADDLDAYDSDCDDFSTTKAVLMANLSSYRSDVLSKIRLMLYDGSVIAKETNVISIADSEETLMLEEENFGKRFVPQQELSDEQAFWLQTSHLNTDQSASSPIKIEAPRELPKITPDALTEGEWGFV
nr:hypothetical protein [Tanacetum cinerariifolium]